MWLCGLAWAVWRICGREVYPMVYSGHDFFLCQSFLLRTVVVELMPETSSFRFVLFVPLSSWMWFCFNHFVCSSFFVVFVHKCCSNACLCLFVCMWSRLSSDLVVCPGFDELPASKSVSAVFLCTLARVVHMFRNMRGSCHFLVLRLEWFLLLFWSLLPLFVFLNKYLMIWMECGIAMLVPFLFLFIL